MSDLQALHAFVSGRVQGVGFRYFTRTTADALGLTGWVRNLPDGRVELLAQGDSATLETFVASLRRAYSGAQVDDIAMSWQDHPTETFPSFDIGH